MKTLAHNRQGPLTYFLFLVHVKIPNGLDARSEKLGVVKSSYFTMSAIFSIWHVAGFFHAILGPNWSIESPESWIYGLLGCNLSLLAFKLSF